MFDLFEEHRCLSFGESTLCILARDRLALLVKERAAYWKQRGKIKHITKGDASTKYFHAHATIKHRKNNIACLQDGLENAITDHEEKAMILWKTFKDRLGRSEFKEMLFNLDHLLTNHVPLNELEAPFSK